MKQLMTNIENQGSMNCIKMIPSEARSTTLSITHPLKLVRLCRLAIAPSIQSPSMFIIKSTNAIQTNPSRYAQAKPRAANNDSIDTMVGFRFGQGIRVSQ